MNAPGTILGDPALCRWMWRWHGYAGLFIVPFIFWMSLTGLPYVWATELENLWHPEYRALTPQAARVSYQAQLETARSRIGAQLPLLRVKLDADHRLHPGEVAPGLPRLTSTVDLVLAGKRRKPEDGTQDLSCILSLLSLSSITEFCLVRRVI